MSECFDVFANAFFFSTYPKKVTLLRNKDRGKKWERKSQTGEERGRKKNSTKKAEIKPMEETVIGI